jgi:uncharacterized protein with PIN domain
MRFIADSMLGRLTKWLRFLGYDVLYFRDIEDRELVRIARKEGRTLITRDRRLTEEFRVKHLLVGSEDIRNQLMEILTKFPLDSERQRRCMKCNTPLEEIEDKRTIKDQVPDYIYMATEAFQLCQTCGSIYWKGSHTKNIIGFLERIRAYL